MITIIPEWFWEMIIKLIVVDSHLLRFKARVQCFKKLMLSPHIAACSWLMFIMLLRVPEICASNVTLQSTVVSLTSTYHATLLLPTVNIVNAMKKDIPLSVSEKEVTVSGETDNEDYPEDSDEIDDDDDMKMLNYSAVGMIIGGPCEGSCDKRLHHVVCNPFSNKCECEKSYPVKLGTQKGCAKPKKLGEHCFYDLTCMHNDENAACVQINHNAICECREGYHVVTHSKPSRRTFCTKDLSAIASDLPTLLGVSTGIFVLAGLICMVLHLFSKTKYPRTRSFADAHAGPPVFFASDTGIPLTIQSNRPSSRSSQRSASGSIGSFTRRSSGILHSGKGINVSQSRQGSRRPSLASVHSTTSSIRSYSSRRFEQELRDKELRQEMKKQLCRLQEQQQLQKTRPMIIEPVPYTIQTARQTPHILTPNSTDELLPCVEENDEFSPQFDRKNPQ